MFSLPVYLVYVGPPLCAGYSHTLSNMDKICATSENLSWCQILHKDKTLQLTTMNKSFLTAKSFVIKDCIIASDFLWPNAFFEQHVVKIVCTLVLPVIKITVIYKYFAPHMYQLHLLPLSACFLLHLKRCTKLMHTLECMDGFCLRRVFQMYPYSKFKSLGLSYSYTAFLT